VELLDEMAARLSHRSRNFLLYSLASRGVAMVTGARCEQINDDGLVITSRRGRRQMISADTIVIAAGSMPNRALVEELDGRVKELYIIGDCVEPRRIANAVEEGFRAGCEI
jgi:thioredoxin reductase